MRNTDNVRCVCYEHNGGIAMFSPFCPNCGRFIKAKEIWINGLDEIKDEPNATCSKCGDIKMDFEGWFDPEELEPISTPS